MRGRQILAAVVAASLGALVVQPLAGSAATISTVHNVVGSLTHIASPPSIKVPTVTVPPVTVPSVTTPAVSTPVVTVPPVTTPSVTTPPVSTPSGGSTAPVSSGTQKVSSTVGSVVNKVTSTVQGAGSSAASGVSSTASQTLSNVTGSPANANGSSNTTAGGSAGSAASAPSTSGGGSSPAARATSARRSASHRVQTRAERAAEAQATAESRRLRQLVVSLRGCLSSLNTGSQRLLTLRAGLTAAPRSAQTVARILHVTVTREQMLEQLALIELQASAGSGCANVPGSAQQTPDVTAPMPAVGLTTLPAWVSGGGAAASPASLKTAAASGSSSNADGRPGSHPSHGGKVVVVTQAASRTVERAGTGSSLPAAAIPAFAALLLGLCLVALPGVRRRLIPAAASGRAQRPAHERTSAMTSASGLRTPSQPRLRAGDEPARIGEPPAAVANPQAEGQAPRAAAPAPKARSERSAWVREHAGQAMVVATVVAGGVVRVLTRGRSRKSGR